MNTKNIALIFAGGVGQRMHNGAKPKQFLELNGKAIIIYTLEVFENCDEISDIVVVCVEGWEKYLQSIIEKNSIKKVRFIVTGGKNPQESQFIGMQAIDRNLNPGSGAVILLHDGVRPLIDEETIRLNIKSVHENGSAVTVTPAIETIVSTTDHNSIATVAKRSDFLMAKAPQSYYFEDIYKIYQRAYKDNRKDFIDSASVLHAYGKELYLVEGSTNNIKITTPVDFYIFKGILEAKSQENIFGI